jgi:uncharacterized phosphosugar-binding protein
MTNSPVHRYHQVLNSIYSRIMETQMPALEQAASWIAEVVESDNLIYTLGSGHSLLIATELYYRAGGIAHFDVVHDKTFGRAERLPGYAKVLLESYPISERNLLILVSNSGRNELTVEMALEAKARNIRTIAITSLAHSLSAAPRTASGLRLCEVADLVIDNCGCIGDSSVELSSAHGSVDVAPTSTAAGIFIANSIVALTAQKLLDQGIDPPVFASANLDSGDTKNKNLLQFLQQRVRGL